MISPYVSQMSRRSLREPNKLPRRSALFDDETEDDVNTRPATDVFDPVVPMASPVTKTYSKNIGSTEHDQKMDIAFDLLVSSPEERSLDNNSEQSFSSKKKTRQSVKFSGSTENMSVNSAISTPSRKQKGAGPVDENRSPNLPNTGALDTSPCLRKPRVSSFANILFSVKYLH